MNNNYCYFKSLSFKTDLLNIIITKALDFLLRHEKWLQANKPCGLEDFID